MPYVTFIDLANSINTIGGSKVKEVHHAAGAHIGLCHVDKSFPISINESEFNLMHDTVVKHNLQCGFELATGTGISTIGIGRAFAQTGGRLISMDSYYEEDTQAIANIEHPTYTADDLKRIQDNSYAFKFIDKFVNAEKLPVDLHIGWSPEDIIKVLAGKTIDFAFFDCPKSDGEFHRDINAIFPFVNKEKFFIFVHDTHTHTEKSFELAKDLFKVDMKRIHSYYEGTPNAKTWKYPLALITNQS